jgi:hypothetical protein
MMIAAFKTVTTRHIPERPLPILPSRIAGEGSLRFRGGRVASRCEIVYLTIIEEYRGNRFLSSNSARARTLASRIDQRRISRLGHGAAIALIGWYLMVPPLPKPNASLSRWKILKILESEAECRAHRKKMLQEVEDDESGESSVITFETPQGEKQFVARAADCFDSTDPRLHHRSLLHRHPQNKP